MHILPKQWNTAAHQLWISGQKMPAIQQVLDEINQHSIKPVELTLQLSYYLFLFGDRAAAAQVLQQGLLQHPEHLEMMRNLAVCLSLTQQHEQSIEVWQRYLKQQPNDYLVYDSLAANYARLKQFAQAQAAGEQALLLKDQQHGQPPEGWQLPQGTPQQFLQRKAELTSVISFSLWGDQPRYLRGAIDNAQASAYLYPDWQIRFYVDESVPKALLDILLSYGANIIQQPMEQSTRQKLAWRFLVANDAQVGRFLVRDVDSVLSLRERVAVEQWINSTQWFHLMRDWWTHTDLILAGMWGGIAGVLPDVSAMLQGYVSNSMETPNIDQWFLRDELWRYIKSSCYIHDRCYRSFNAQPWPSATPIVPIHVGQDESVGQTAAQLKRLSAWQDVACLKWIK